MHKIRAISIKQPFANMIASGQKTIETRSQKTSYRGPLLIVSSKSPKYPPPAGFAVAVTNLVDCRPMNRLDEEAACCKFYYGLWAWILEETEAIVPFPVKGQLGLYWVERDEALWLRKAFSDDPTIHLPLTNEVIKRLTE